MKNCVHDFPATEKCSVSDSYSFVTDPGQNLMSIYMSSYHKNLEFFKKNNYLIFVATVCLLLQK